MTSTDLSLPSLLAAHFDEVAESGLELARRIPQYAAIPIEPLRKSVQGGFSAILADLREPPFVRFSNLFSELGYKRARQGFDVNDLSSVIAITEAQLIALIKARISDARLQVPAIIECHDVCGTARTAIMDSFRRANQEFLSEANATIAQLSAPLLPLYPGIIVMPIVGALNTGRAQVIQESFLQGISTHRARVAILDITGLINVNSEAAGHLMRAAHAARLLGSRVVLTGVQPEAARVFSELNLELSGVSAQRNLQSGLQQAFNERGVTLQERTPQVRGTSQ
jgi:anti-anti-sigma regulatory factor